jgi:hypothetical protein
MPQPAHSHSGAIAQRNWGHSQRAHSEKQIKIHWQFSIEKARTKLNSAYTKVNGLNQQYQRT